MKARNTHNVLCDGDTIRLDLPITLKEAVTGAKVRVPTVDGPVMLTVPAGSSSGKTLRLKGRGFSAKGGARGDRSAIDTFMAIEERVDRFPPARSLPVRHGRHIVDGARIG